MRIVTDGKQYAIEKGWILKKYLDLYNRRDWEPLKYSYNFCWGNKETVEGVFNFISRKKNLQAVKEKNEN